MPETARKVTITYEYDRQMSPHFKASADGLIAYAESFAKARARLLDKLRAEPVAVPPPEEVELEEAASCKS